jgi:hypothetical protein
MGKKDMAQALAAAEKLGYKTIMWTVDTVDWKGGSGEAIAQKVVSNAQNGAIILMHPKDVTVEALPIMIKELKVNYWILVAVVFSTSLGLLVGIPVGVYAVTYNNPQLSSNGMTIAMIMLIGSIITLFMIYVKDYIDRKKRVINT